VALVAKVKRFLAKDKATYERLQAQKRYRGDVREDALDDRLQKGYPAEEAWKQSIWIP
jgi:hypothetical protein